MCESTNPVPKILHNLKIKQWCGVGTIKGFVAAKWEFLHCYFPSPLLDLAISDVKKVVSTDKNKINCSYVLHLILFSLRLLRHLIIGMDAILPSVESWWYYNASYIHTETLRSGLFAFFSKVSIILWGIQEIIKYFRQFSYLLSFQMSCTLHAFTS